MKKFFATLVIAIVAMSASAQTYIGGGLGFSTTDKEGSEDNLTQFTLAPEVGYNLSDKWAIGMAINYTYAKQGSSANAIGVAPYARYTVAKAGNFSFYIDGEFQFASVKHEDEDAQNGWSLGLKPGVRFDVNKNIFLTATVGFFGYQDTNDINGEKTFGFGFNGAGYDNFSGSNGLKLGIYYNF